jgi:hypothetical protein
MTYDSINPSHYHGDRKYEPIAVIEDWKLNYRMGNVLKYLSRNGRKPGEDPIEGLKKMIWYIEREIASLEGSLDKIEVPYEDVLEDYAACQVDSTYSVIVDDLWDPSVGPIEPELSGQSCELDLNELHQDLDKFEEGEIVSTFERRGLIFGVDKSGKTYILGIADYYD